MSERTMRRVDDIDEPRWTCPECYGLATDDGTPTGDPCPVCDGDGVIESWMLYLEPTK